MEQLEVEEGFRMLSQILSPAVGSEDETRGSGQGLGDAGW